MVLLGLMFQIALRREAKTNKQTNGKMKNGNNRSLFYILCRKKKSFTAKGHTEDPIKISCFEL